MSAGNPRFLLTIVCDDVRHEMGNKLSMMGVYENSIILESFPAVVPRLCFVMKARSPADRPFERLTFVVRRDDEVILEAELQQAQLAAMAAQPAPPAPAGSTAEFTDRAVQVMAVMVVSPVAFEKPCLLRFRAITESEELLGGTLVVTAAAAPPHAELGAAAEAGVRD